MEKMSKINVASVYISLHSNESVKLAPPWGTPYSRKPSLYKIRDCLYKIVQNVYKIHAEFQANRIKIESGGDFECEVGSPMGVPLFLENQACTKFGIGCTKLYKMCTKFMQSFKPIGETFKNGGANFTQVQRFRVESTPH